MELPRAPRINPSILAADFVNMQADLARIATADFAHVDVMDNHFVPNLTFGPQMVERIQATSPIPLDVHLMITDPSDGLPSTRRSARRASPSISRPRTTPSRWRAGSARSALGPESR